jgi:glutamyl-tRNA synthetase
VRPMRVRFAPSPTGYLHVGGARTALYNWLAARHEGGTFILRSDDTDQARSRPEYYQDIVDSLRWLGLVWDEGIEVGGPHAPYRQSERLDRYREVADKLLGEGRAYRCFCTPDELEARRRQAVEEGRPPGYDGRCRAIDPAEAARRADRGEPASLRFGVPITGSTTFTDLIRGRLTFEHQYVDDFVILRSDGSPTYHLASTVDDVDFRITHVVRGEDILSSTPKHLLLAEAMGSSTEITFAHLSMLVGPDGQKLSKRHGDVSVHAYREAGYLSEAMVNYLAILGWSHDPERTIYHREDLVELFELARVSRNPATFDIVKLEWMNGVYMRELDPVDFAERSRPFVEAELGRTVGSEEWERVRQLAPLLQERVKLLTETAGLVRFVLDEELTVDEQSWAKVMGGPEAAVALEGSLARLGDLEQWTAPAIEEALRSMLEEFGLNARKGLQPIRVATTGSAVSPPLFESLAVLGKKRTVERLTEARERLSAS